MAWMIAALLGACLGHIVRRFTPHLLQFKEQERSLPFNFPWPEGLAALIFAAFAAEYGPNPVLLKWFCFALLVLIPVCSDALAKYIVAIPVYVGTVLGLVLSAAFPLDILQFMDQAYLFGVEPPAYMHTFRLAGLGVGFAGAITGFALLELIRRVFSRMVSMEVMGAGDSLMFMMIGAFIGPKMVVVSLLPACVIGILIGLIYKLRTGMPHTPFGPALGFSGLLTALYSDILLSGLTGYRGMLANLPPWALSAFSLILLVIAFLLVLRIIKRRDLYEEQVEADYRNIDEKIKS